MSSGTAGGGWIPSSDEPIIVHPVSALSLLGRLVEPGSADLILLDPPAKLSEHHSDESPADHKLSILAPLAEACEKALRPGGSTILFGDAQTTAAWEIAASWAKLNHHAEMTVIWNISKHKQRLSTIASLTTAIRWHVKTGDRGVGERETLIMASNVIVCYQVPVQWRVHVSQLPAELYNYVITLVTCRDALVVDPFTGSGASVVACSMTSRRCIAGDIDPDTCQYAPARIDHIELEESYLRPLSLWINGKSLEIVGD